MIINVNARNTSKIKLKGGIERTMRNEEEDEVVHTVADRWKKIESVIFPSTITTITFPRFVSFIESLPHYAWDIYIYIYISSIRSDPSPNHNLIYQNPREVAKRSGIYIYIYKGREAAGV